MGGGGLCRLWMRGVVQGGNHIRKRVGGGNIVLLRVMVIHGNKKGGSGGCCKLCPAVPNV